MPQVTVDFGCPRANYVMRKRGSRTPAKPPGAPLRYRCACSAACLPPIALGKSFHRRDAENTRTPLHAVILRLVLPNALRGANSTRLRGLLTELGLRGFVNTSHVQMK